MMEARLYTKLDSAQVQCDLCAHHCRIAPGHRGRCGVRENVDGTLVSRVYGRLVSTAVDPIEKKPLYHVLPGSRALSIATVGCNLRCQFCQNSEISQWPREHDTIPGRYAPPEAVVEAAQQHDCASIAYTYTEPTVYYETTVDIGAQAQAAGILNLYISNGYMSREMLDTVCGPDQPPLIDAANIDLKAFRDAFYRQYCGASLQPVLDNLRTMVRNGIWVEVTTLVIPGLNDSPEELGEIAAFIAEEMGVDTPWHVSRFHPTYQMLDRPPTPAATVLRAREIGLAAGLRYVYPGNIPGSDAEDTRCPNCGALLVERRGFSARVMRLEGSTCAECGHRIAGIWQRCSQT